MEIQHVNVKIFVDGDMSVDESRFIEIFHRWIEHQSFDELLIDVADYRHVPAGPGVMLIGHEADYNMDVTDGRYGLRYNRKARSEGSNEERIRNAFQAAAIACSRLEAELEGSDSLRFSRNEFEIFVNDRALAPNTPDTLSVCQPIFESALITVFRDNSFDLRHQDDPRRLFGFHGWTSSPFDFSELANLRSYS